jgi:uncharacterized membrane protein YphA (DoxX/SURF4 family)
MAIGWHFFVEGYEKERSIQLGVQELPHDTKKPFSSEGFFREGTGPVAKLFRAKVGDTDDMALARMTIRGDANNPQMPGALEQDWDGYFTRFVNHYQLDADQQQRAKAALDQEKEQTAKWFVVRPGTVQWVLSGLWNDVDRPATFKRNYTDGTYDVNLTISERVDEYRRKVQEYRDLQQGRRYSLGKDVDKAERGPVRAQVAALRNELQKLVDGRTEQMKKSLADAAKLADEQKARGPVPDAPKHWLIRYLDATTPWLLMVVGIGLLFGLFSRTSALLGALFLLMTILTWPALPWLPAPPNSEGNYLIISKNVIEMLALLMLACIPSGQWFGVDALLQALNPFRKKKVKE